MPVYVDASALVALHVEGASRLSVEEHLLADREWCTSAITLVEALALVDRVVDEPADRSELEDLIRLTWDRIAVVPVDARCLDLAGRLLRAQPLRLSDAIHLAAADRLGHPLTFLTLDPAQIPVALSLGFDVVPG